MPRESAIVRVFKRDVFFIYISLSLGLCAQKALAHSPFSVSLRVGFASRSSWCSAAGKSATNHSEGQPRLRLGSRRRASHGECEED